MHHLLGAHGARALHDAARGDAVVHAASDGGSEYPALGAVADGRDELAVVLDLRRVDDDLELGAQEVEILVVAGEHEGAFDGGVDAVEHDVVALVVVPAVLAAPEDALASAADDAVVVDVVGGDAAVLVRAVDPGFEVVEDPLLVLVVAGVEVGVGDEGRSRESVGGVALEHELVEEVDDVGPALRVLEPVGLEVRDDGVEAGADAVVVDLAAEVAARKEHGVRPVYVAFQHGALAGLEGRADDPLARVPEVGLRVLADVHGCEAP